MNNTSVIPMRALPLAGHVNLGPSSEEREELQRRMIEGVLKVAKSVTVPLLDSAWDHRPFTIISGRQIGFEKPFSRSALIERVSPLGALPLTAGEIFRVLLQHQAPILRARCSLVGMEPLSGPDDERYIFAFHFDGQHIIVEHVAAGPEVRFNVDVDWFFLIGPPTR